MSFESAAWLVALVGTSIGPWRLLGDARGFVWVWLVGHAALLAPVAGVLLADYHVVRRRNLDLDGLYDRTEPAEDGSSAGGGAYWYGNGTNGVALLAFAFGACFCVPGFLGACGLESHFLPAPAARFFAACYQHAWFVGFASAFVAHAGLSEGLARMGRR
jgi:NCS1 family nucleobase:cation symporter-1